MENKRWEAERVIAVEVGQENHLYVSRIHAAAVHVRQKGRAAVEEQAPIHDHGPVVSLRGKCRAGPQKS
jgi:hypothetical protein